jgi:hypothetical protein
MLGCVPSRYTWVRHPKLQNDLIKSSRNLHRGLRQQNCYSLRGWYVQKQLLPLKLPGHAETFYNPRHMDAEPLKPVPTFSGVAEAAAHFKRLHETRVQAGISGDLAGVGERCILIGGPRNHKPGDVLKQLRNSFWRRGVRVSSAGPHGNRTITVRGFKEEYVRPRA